MIITHEEIANRARAIWEKEGRPEGRDQQHWLQAECELRQESDRGRTTPGAMSESPELAKVSGGDKNGSSSRKRSGRRSR